MTRPIDTSLEQRLPLGTDLALRRQFMVVNEPLPGNLRFGRLLEVLDALAEEAALRHVRGAAPQAYVVTAAIDQVVLRTPADVARDTVLKARLNLVGRSSMEVGIRVEQPGVEPAHVASCYFTMVARVGEGDAAESIAVEPLEYPEEIDVSRRDKAIRRRELYRRRLASAARPPRARNTISWRGCTRPRSSRVLPACSPGGSPPWRGSGSIPSSSTCRARHSGGISCGGPTS